MVASAPMAVLAGNPRRRRREVDEFLPQLEWLTHGISDDGWKHLSNDVIASIHSFPLEWTSVMRRMAMACEYFR